MAICSKCKAEIQSDANFCPSCGQAIQQTTEEDMKVFRGLSIVSYLGILILIPLLTGRYKDSAFLKHHTNQGAVLLISAIIMYIGCFILSTILMPLAGRGNILMVLISFMTFLPSLALLIFIIIGIVNAANGETKNLPIIGRLKVIK